MRTNKFGSWNKRNFIDELSEEKFRDRTSCLRSGMVNLLNMKVVGICGVSGSGKSTVANYIASHHPTEVSLLSLDDYFKSSREIGLPRNEINWEDLSVIKFEALIDDIKKLQSGKSIKVLSKSKFYNPNFDYAAHNKIEVEVFPKEVLILEGFLLFANEDLRNLIDVKVYLDLSIEEGLKRRDSDKHAPSDEYVKNYILPCFKQHIEGNKQYADFVIDADKENIASVMEKIEEILALA